MYPYLDDLLLCICQFFLNLVFMNFIPLKLFFLIINLFKNKNIFDVIKNNY